jgi:hypothetical protein
MQTDEGHREAGDRSEEDEARKDEVKAKDDLTNFLGMAIVIVITAIAYGLKINHII